MAIRFIQRKQQKFYFINDDGHRKFFKLIYGDEVQTLTTPAPSGDKWTTVKCRGRLGEIKDNGLAHKRSAEMYFLDIGQGDAVYIVTPNNTKILVDGGLRDRALGFLIWKYQLDQPHKRLSIDHMLLSHADNDHVSGLIPLLNHPKITVKNIWHSGIAVYKDPAFNQALGEVMNGQLTTRHSSLDDLGTKVLSKGFKKWVTAVVASGANYSALDSRIGTLDIGDPEITLDILSPVMEPNETYDWLGSKSETINGHSLTFRMTYGHVRTFFSGDLNTKGSKHLMKQPNMALKLNAHIFKSPHHGSHDYHQPLFNAISPMISVVSSGDSPDHGHPRASFLGGLGLAGRGESPLVFSTEVAATFTEAGDKAAISDNEPTTLGDLDFSSSAANAIARQRFKKVLSGIINVRTDG